MAKGTGRDKDGSDDQPRRLCATQEVHERLLRTDPAYVNNRMVSEANAIARVARGAMRTGVCVIPVVVHVVHKTSTQNISDAQVKSQIEILNRDFRKTNSDVSTVPAAFQPLVADARIEFVLASKDPKGNATSGITRTSTSANSFSFDDKVKAASSGGVDPWPTDKYLNIWVCQLGGGLLGYAQFPGGPAATDGVVVTHTAFGNTGTAAAPFDQGRTSTHEIGHWLNLRHIWGDIIGCSGSDLVADTPNQSGPNYGCPTFPKVTCSNGPNGDLFMNYMDYVDDACMVMFSAGQVARMDACLDGDRTGICASKPSATLKFVDDLPTLKFIDDPVTLKFRDDPITLKFADDPITLKFSDDPKIKAVDDPQTLKYFDDGPLTSPAIDPLKLQVLDKPPQLDVAGPVKPIGDLPDFGAPINVGPFFGGFGRGGAAPFVLSTGHHSMAWAQSHPAAAQQARSGVEQTLSQYQQALAAYAQAAQAGQLSEQDLEMANRLYEEFESLLQEHQRLSGG